MYSIVYAIFMCELQKIFFLRDIMVNQCVNIFSGSTWEFIREWNGMEWDGHMGMERNGMEWNVFK